ncbi:hypothetical protein ACH44C_15335 [Streptomyces purpureus]|uniref:hypothetical protein n=1 Tax=Streptomyces purpureus TaxID=1951 RepID=UPI00378AA053
MTQSGQGQEPRLPAARPAHEGVVLPSDGSGPWVPDAAGPAGGQPWGGAWGPGGQQPPPPAQPPAQPPAVGAQPLPPEAVPGVTGAEATQYLPPVPAASSQAEATQYLPPVAPGSSQAEATQYLPPVAPGSSQAEATQYLPPVQAGPMPGAMPGPTPGPMPGAAPGPMPGAMPPERPEESTHFLGTGPVTPPPVAGGDSEATQYIPPVPAQNIPAPPPGAPYGIRPGSPDERQPPPEFDSLFRSDSTQQMPVPPAPQQPHQQYPQHQGPRQPQFQQQPPQHYAPQQGYYDDEPEPRRRKSPVALIAAVVIGCTVVGLGAGALLNGGDDEKDKGTGQPVANSSPAASAAPEKKPVDPAEPQAKALDKLLADSNNSREAVIRSVENIKKCANLDQAATDLRGAAEQRRSLVTRLQGIAVDKLPGHAALTASLNKAWNASATADDHYAAWALQVKGKKGCKDGKARNTPSTARAHKASGEATLAKRDASKRWNAIAEKYSLTKRSSTQL